MFLETYIWCWIHLHPGHVLRKLAKLLMLAALVLVPLIYMNAEMIRKGVDPTPPSFELQASHPSPGY